MNEHWDTALSLVQDARREVASALETVSEAVDALQAEREMYRNENLRLVERAEKAEALATKFGKEVGRQARSIELLRAQRVGLEVTLAERSASLLAEIKDSEELDPELQHCFRMVIDKLEEMTGG